MPEDYTPWLVEPGWVDFVFLQDLPGPSYRLLRYPDGIRRFEHRCDRGERGVVVCAPALSPGHRVVADDPLTIEGSILCPDCGTHGFVRDGRWARA